MSERRYLLRVEFLPQAVIRNSRITAADGKKGEAEKTSLNRLIASTDSEIDKLVYELYGLTEEEISIVEEGTTGR